jgi:hypothetical protein
MSIAGNVATKMSGVMRLSFVILGSFRPNVTALVLVAAVVVLLIL